MAHTLTRPVHDGDERTQLMGWYALQRGIVHLKCKGLSDEAAHRAVIPTSPLMTVAGIVSHLRWAEELWFTEVLLGNPGRGRGFGPESKGVEDPEFRVDNVSLDVLLTEYAAECDRSDAALASRDLDDTGSTALHTVGSASVRWMVMHMLEETARHAGQLDIIRETIDGKKSYF